MRMLTTLTLSMATLPALAELSQTPYDSTVEYEVEAVAMYQFYSHDEIVEQGINTEEAGLEVFSLLTGNGHLPYEFVANDPRRAVRNGAGSGGTVTYEIINKLPSAQGAFSSGQFANLAQTYLDESAVEQIVRDQFNAFASLSCMAPMQEVSNLSPANGWYERRAQIGPMPIADQNNPGADIRYYGMTNWAQNPSFSSSFPLGVAVAYIYKLPNGQPTDIDGDGAQDLAFQEIYLNTRYQWADNETNISKTFKPVQRADGATVYRRIFGLAEVVAHEVGHGLSLAHLGNHATTNQGELKLSPENLMNVVYDFRGSTVEKRTSGQVCGLYGHWNSN